MDKSEANIKMCEKAEKIQKLWKPTNGDFCWHDNAGDDIWGHWEYPAETCLVVISEAKPIDWWYNWLWLPRQDQLQEMVKYFKNLPPAEYSSRGLLQAFWEFVDNEWLEYLWTITDEQVSMEQLWLAFVMKEKYRKIWNGEDWVKES